MSLKMSLKIEEGLGTYMYKIWNPGQLPLQLRIDDLKKSHPSIPHNPLLFKQFYRAAYVEDVGGGTIDIIRKMQGYWTTRAGI